MRDEEDCEVSSHERLERQLDAAADRLAAERPYITHDELGQFWLVPLDLIQDCYTYERAVDLAERAGEDAGFTWGIHNATVADLERLAAASIDMSASVIPPSSMYQAMADREVPAEFVYAFLRGFVSGALTFWEVTKERVIDRLLNRAP